MRKHHNSTPPVDEGARPAVLSLWETARENNDFRRTLWTGEHLQLTVMCIPQGEDIGTEMHPRLDQLIRVEEGYASVRFGSCRSGIREMGRMGAGDAVLIPAGTYHNLTNVGRSPLRLSSVYAPPAHARGTVHLTKEEALGEEH